MLPAEKRGGRHRTVDMREVVNAVLYILRTGCQWRNLPHDFPPWGTVSWYFWLWCNDGTWARIHDRLLETLPWEAVNKNREASYYSMKSIMIHIIDNEDWIANWVVQDKGTEYKRARKSEEYTNMQMIREHLDRVEKKTRAYLEAADEKELQRRVNFVLSSGTVFNLSVEESLIQSFTEQLYHLGELIALLWQDDIEPPKMQWFWNNPRTPS